jgi:hypothetical protein
MMRFYYASLFSTLLWIVYCVIVIPLSWLVWAKLLGRKLTLRSAAISALVIAMLPWTEELWIAYRFSQLCRKDAGVFINKVVTVDGFYDDTSGGVLSLVEPGRYRFVEGHDRSGYVRVSMGDAAFMQQALSRFQAENPQKDVSKLDLVRVKLDEDTEAIIYPKQGKSWRVIKLDHPTARYQYRRVDSHTPVAIGVKRFENVVLDTQTGERLGRYTDYSRGPHWFYIGLDAPSIECAETRGTDPIVYRSILNPAK